MEEHWVDSVRQLRALDSAAWLNMGLPHGLYADLQSHLAESPDEVERQVSEERPLGGTTYKFPRFPEQLVKIVSYFWALVYSCPLRMQRWKVDLAYSADVKEMIVEQNSSITIVATLLFSEAIEMYTMLGPNNSLVQWIQ